MTGPSWFSAALSTAGSDVKTEYSKDRVPLDSALVEILLKYRAECYPSSRGLALCESPDRAHTTRNNPAETYSESRGECGLGDGIGWHTFRHSYRSWMDDTGAPMTVQKELMRHASIQTWMNVYGKAMTDSKRQAHSKIVEMVLKGRNSSEVMVLERRAAAIGS